MLTRIAVERGCVVGEEMREEGCEKVFGVGVGIEEVRVRGWPVG